MSVQIGLAQPSPSFFNFFIFQNSVLLWMIFINERHIIRYRGFSGKRPVREYHWPFNLLRPLYMPTSFRWVSVVVVQIHFRISLVVLLLHLTSSVRREWKHVYFQRRTTSPLHSSNSYFYSFFSVIGLLLCKIWRIIVKTNANTYIFTCLEVLGRISYHVYFKRLSVMRIILPAK